MARKGVNVITVRGVPPDVAKVIRQRATRTGTSVNRVVIGLLEEGAGVRRKPRRVLHHDLDHLAGAWSREEARAFEKALQEQRRIDPELWK